MKFSHSLQFNCVPEWTDHYISYNALKKLIFQIEKAQHEEANGALNVQSIAKIDSLPTLFSQPQSALLETTFLEMVERDSNRVASFFADRERVCIAELEKLRDMRAEFEGLPSDDLEKGSHRVSHIGQEEHASDEPHRAALQAKAEKLYVELCDLRDYIQLNYTGLAKILKKHDKFTRNPVEAIMLRTVESILPLKRLPEVEKYIDEVETIYAHTLHGGNVEAASSVLRHLLREKLLIGRANIWQDMVKQERKAASVTIAEPISRKPKTFWQRFQKPIVLLFALAIFLGLVTFPVFPGAQGVFKSRCLAMLTFCTILWCSETMPLFVTALIVPLLVILFKILPCEDGVTPLAAPVATDVIFKSMFSHVTILLLGGFAIAAAMSKYGVARAMALAILSRSGSKPAVIVLVNMAVCTFASMWVSNIAAPILSFTLIQPILRTLTVDHPLAKSLILGIAFAANIGGLASPISSPQNVVALQYIDVQWAQWLGIAIPVSILAVLSCWAILMLVFPLGNHKTEISVLRASEEPFGLKQYYIIAVTFATVVLWCVSKLFKQHLGDMGVISIIPLVAFFGTGLLTKDDFNSFYWHIVILAMGGSAMGEAVKRSGLLKAFGDAIVGLLIGRSMFVINAFFCLMITVVTLFISHTVGAMIFLPIIQQVGKELGAECLLVLAACFTCSAGMGLPISSFPNMNATAQEDATGRPFIRTIDFLKSGIFCSFAVYLIIITAGYGLINAFGLIK